MRSVRFPAIRPTVTVVRVLQRVFTGLLPIVAVPIVAVLMVGCSPYPPLNQPTLLMSPFPATQVWAVVPFANESGVSTADGARVGDQFVKVIEETSGLSCVALNRTLAVMQTLDMRAVMTNADAIRLREAMGVDGLVVGTITNWDPYPPPRIGLAAQVYLRPGLVDPATTRTIDPNRPASLASGVFDASNHAVIAALRRYSISRHQPGGPYGEDIYLVDMSRFSEFASHEILNDLLVRLSPKPRQ